MMLLQMQRDLSLPFLPDYFAQIYPKVKEEFEARSALILSDEYIEGIINEALILKPYADLIKESAKRIRQNPAMRLYVCLLEYRIKSKQLISAEGFTPPAENGIEFDFLHLFPALSSIPESILFFKRRGVAQDIITATMKEFDFCVENCIDKLGRPAFTFDRLSWILRITNNEMIRIGRFKYDMPSKRVQGIKAYKNRNNELVVLANGVDAHPCGKIFGSAGLCGEGERFFAEIFESDTEISGHPIVDGLIQREPVTLQKCEWDLCLSPDDEVISIHIPPHESFDRDTCEASYERAREVFATHFPDMPYKAFHCRTWMVSPDLKAVLKPSSNILAFQSKFTLYPTKSQGRWVFDNVFPDQAVVRDYGELPENTSLQRGVKELYLKGGCIHEFSGFFF